MPEIVSQIHRLFIVNHVNCLCLTTELSEPRAAGLSRIFCFPDFVSTCLQELVIRNSFCSCTFEFKDVSSHFDFQAVQKTSVHLSTMIHLFHTSYLSLSPSCMNLRPNHFTTFTTSFHGYK